MYSIYDKPGHDAVKARMAARKRAEAVQVGAMADAAEAKGDIKKRDELMVKWEKLMEDARDLDGNDE